MPGNSIGQIFRITTLGESHGNMIATCIDGCPAGLKINEDQIRSDLSLRRPGSTTGSTSRIEDDDFVIQSGIFDGVTTGAPILIIIPNNNVKSEHYESLKDVFRPSHADYSYQVKYGVRDYKGGGRSSARETVARVVAGSIAKQICSLYNIKITAFVSAIGPVKTGKSYQELLLENRLSNPVRCPDPEAAQAMIRLIDETAREGDSLGGVIQCVITGTPPGLGEPVFDKLEAELAKAILSIHAVKGFEIGSGFDGSRMKGSAHNDPFIVSGNKISTKTNFSGGIQGGISNGMDIYFKCAFKPVASIKSTQETVNTQGNPQNITIQGRHDACVVPRAIPIVEAMTAITLADHLLRARLAKIS